MVWLWSKFALLLCCVLCGNVCCSLFSRASASRASVSRLWMQSEGEPTIGDLGRMTTKAALLAVSGPAPSPDVKNYAFKGVDIVKSAPTVCRFVLGNPKALFENPLIAKSVGLDFSTLDMATPLSALAPLLPVLYVADWHSEYGTLGFLLNKPTGQTLGEVKPEYKAFRQRPVYLGGVNNRGNSFTMMHAKAGFTDNRPFRALPPDNSASASSTAASPTVPSYSFKLFFSPDVAMANELCLTNDASPSDFKFFQWAHVWLPNQLELEYTRKAWLTVAAPQEVIFCDDGGAAKPLWQRLVHSLPPTRLG